MKERIIKNIDNYVMASRILETLDAYLTTNEDVMETEHITNVREQIEAVERYRKNFLISIFRDIKKLEKDALHWH